MKKGVMEVEHHDIEEFSLVPPKIQNSDIHQYSEFLYEDEIPSFVEEQLDLLYQSIFSSIKHFRIYSDIQGVNTYVAKRNESIDTIFLFKKDKNNIEVLNEVIKVNEGQARRFAAYIFSKYNSVSSITFRAVQTTIKELPFPFQLYPYSEDIVVTLPASQKEYFSKLSASTRRTITSYQKKINRDFPSFFVKFYEKENISAEMIHNIIKIIDMRMTSKNKTSSINLNDMNRMIALAKICGFVCITMIDGKICSGTISYRIGENSFMLLNGHDPQYNNYRLGTITCYHSIIELISQSAKECHFLWGRYDYKYSFLGQQRDLERLAIYRSRLHYLANGKMVWRFIVESNKRKFYLLLHSLKGRDTLQSRVWKTITNITAKNKEIKQS